MSPHAASELAFPRPFPRAARALVRPRLGAAATVLVALLCGLLPISRVFESGGGRINLCPADALVPALLLIYRRSWLRSGWVGWWLLALWVTALISWSLSVSVLTPLVLLREIVKVLTCYSYALIGFAIGREPRSESLLVRGLSLAIAVIALGGICAYFTGSPRFLVGNGRVVGTFNDPNAYGVYLAMLFPLLASLPMGWIAVPVLAGGTIASLSRTGLITMGFSMLLSLGHVRLRRYLPLVIACMAALVVMYGNAQRTDKTSNRIMAYQESLSERQSLWALGFEVASTHPLFGIGKGNWEAVTKQRTISHNTFLQVAADSGFIGLLVFLLPLFFCLWSGLRRPDTRPWAVALAVALAGGLAVSFDNFRPFWLVAGLLGGRLSLPAGAAAPVEPASAR
jgi:O-antigen ligase